jgi:hypothetical protein
MEGKEVNAGKKGKEIKASLAGRYIYFPDFPLRNNGSNLDPYTLRIQLWYGQEKVMLQLQIRKICLKQLELKPPKHRCSHMENFCVSQTSSLLSANFSRISN